MASPHDLIWPGSLKHSDSPSPGVTLASLCSQSCAPPPLDLETSPSLPDTALRQCREQLPSISFRLFLSGVQTSLTGRKSVEPAAWLHMDTEVSPSSRSQSRPECLSSQGLGSAPQPSCKWSHGTVRCPWCLVISMPEYAEKTTGLPALAWLFLL